MSTLSSHSPLPHRVRAKIFSKLSALERAGIPADRAWGALEISSISPERLASVQKSISRGSNPVLAAQKMNLFSPLEASIVSAAMNAGGLERAYEKLARFCEQRAKHEKQIKSKMLLPAATLILSLIIQPIPQWAKGDITTAVYLWKIIKPLLVIGIAAELAKRLIKSDWFQRHILELPTFGPAIAAQNAMNFFESLALLLEAGSPMFDALPIAVATIEHPGMNKAYARIKSAMQKGLPLSDALQKEITNHLHLGDARVIEFVATGEASGTLGEMLNRHVRIEADKLHQFWQQVADWTPRIAYVAVALSMITGLPGG